MARRRTRDRQSGFTMVEILVSLVLSAIAMIGIIALYRAQTNASSFSRHNTEATVLAEDRLERLRSQSLSACTAPTSPCTVDAGIDETGKVVAGGLFTRTPTITANGALWDLRVDVSWTEEGNTKHVILNGRRNQ